MAAVRPDRGAAGGDTVESVGQAVEIVLPFRALACNNARADHRLIAACARLKPGEFAEQSDSSGPGGVR
jgi:hypothetical protein